MTQPNSKKGSLKKVKAKIEEILAPIWGPKLPKLKYSDSPSPSTEPFVSFWKDPAFRVGSEPMGDYVGKRKRRKDSGQLLLGDTITVASHHKAIADFSLYAEEHLADDILPILQHYPRK